MEEKINKNIKYSKKVINKDQHIFLRKVKIFFKKYDMVSYAFIGIAIFFLCMMLTAQIKAISNTDEVTQGKRESQLIDQLNTLQKNYDNLKEKYDENSKIVDEYKSNAADNNTLISSMKNELEELTALSGNSDLKGEGIIVTLTDGDKVLDSSSRTDSLVHDSDVLTVVNELKAAGAEAISVNDQRIIATSAIRCVGPVIQVNYQKVAAPFVIKAIGDSQYLESAINIKNGVADMLKELGIGVNVSRQKNIEIKKYNGTLDFKFSQVEK